jgi:hypothetical protein
MTTKEKAIELMKKFDRYARTETNYQIENFGKLNYSMECSLIVIDEILNIKSISLDDFYYYQDIKHEIETLL